MHSEMIFTSISTILQSKNGAVSQNSSREKFQSVQEILKIIANL